MTAWVAIWIAKPQKSPIRVAAALITEGRPNTARLAFGDILDSMQLRRIRTEVGKPFVGLLVAVIPPANLSASKKSYFELLAATHASHGIVSYVVDNPERAESDEVLKALRLNKVGAATALVDSSGKVRYYAKRTLSPDNARLLVERFLFGAAKTEWPVVATTPDVWNSRLRQTRLRDAMNLDSAQSGMSLQNFTHVLVFDAHCSQCVVDEHIRDALRLGTLLRSKGANLATVFPLHYQNVLTHHLDTLRGRTEVYYATPSLAPELAYVSRDDRMAARPIVLQLRGGEVKRVGRLGLAK